MTLSAPALRVRNPCAALELWQSVSCLRSVLRAKGASCEEKPQVSFKYCGLRAADAICARPSLGTCTHRRTQLSCSKGRPRSRLPLRKTDRNKRFPTLKKNDEAPGAHRHHPCSVGADAPARPSQRMNQIVCTLHAIDATTPSTMHHTGFSGGQATQNDLREQPEVGPRGGQEGQGLL